MTRFFSPDYVEHATLRDGTKATVRLLVPADKDILRSAFDRWSEESRYTRFLVPKQRLTDEELRYLTEIDQETHFALGVSSDAGAGLGVARFIRLPDQPGEPPIAEAAIAIADEIQGQGLGKLLFLRLCAAARERGIERFRCEVLGTNTSMKALIEGIAPEHTTTVESGVMSIDFALPAVSPDLATSEPQTGALYRLFRESAKDVVEWTEAVRRIWRR